MHDPAGPATALVLRGEDGDDRGSRGRGPAARWLPLCALVLWLAAVLGGFAFLLSYKSTPGGPARAPQSWPSESRITRSRERPTLVMFLHPHCDCSRASVAELGRTLARVRGRVSARVVFIRPEGTPRGWGQTSLRERVRSLRNVALIDDAGGVDARRFGASTSGTTVIYDRAGRLIFSGGITALRGHEGDSAGQERIVSLLTRHTADRNDSPVFGCELTDPPSPAGARSEDGL